MSFALPIISLIVVSITALRIESISVAEKEHGKTYPSRTIFERDGQYCRLIGPFYAKVEVHGLQKQLLYWKRVYLSASAIPTIDFPSLFVNGAVKYEGSTLYSMDGDVDMCIEGRIDCPYLAGVKIHESMNTSFGELGLFPGWYQGSFEFYTTDINDRKFKAGAIEFKLKVQEN